jgi:hypothetical protein
VYDERNPYGSKLYTKQAITDIGYKEGFAYALSWGPGKPVPAALSSAVHIGQQYQSEYVSGYQAGLNDGIATLAPEVRNAFAVAARNQMVLAVRRLAQMNARSAAEVAKPGHWNQYGEYTNEPGGETVTEDEYRKSSRRVRANKYIKKTGDDWVITQKGTGKGNDRPSSTDQKSAV